ncbi:MAG: hypothetical protein KKA81_01045 [Bacteroidetes bacterium]|nr:hypothetical protein [Bacteroidota bacterium]
MLKYIIPGGIALILIILIIRYFKLFRLVYFKMAYGKYSYRYIALHKKLFVKSPFAYCIKDELDYRIILFLEAKGKSETFETTEHISFGEQPFNCSMNDIFASKGELMCFNAMMHPAMKKELRVVGFRENIFSLDMKALYYLLDNLFFMGEYVFKELNATSKDKLIDLLVQKYKLKTKPSSVPFLIRDPEERMIMFSDTGFSVQLAYMDMKNSTISSSVSGYFQNLKATQAVNRPGIDDDLLSRL